MASDVVDEDRAVLRVATDRVLRCTGVPVAFAGLAVGRDMPLTSFGGTRTTALLGLVIRRGAGLGGRVLTTGRPGTVDDYGADRGISHEYDGHVATEGLRSVLAVPVIADGTVRGVLYGGVRQPQPIGERIARMAMAAAAEAGRELSVRAEVRRRVRDAQEHHDALVAERGLSGSDVEHVRTAYAHLRALAGGVVDASLRIQLDQVTQMLARAMSRDEAHAGAVSLTSRELDVLAQVALGSTNAEAAACLGLSAETVKAYLRSASRKLGTRSRIEAVHAARRAGLLP